MNSKDLLHTIINDFYDFNSHESESDQASMQKFVAFLNTKYDTEKIEVRPLTDADTEIDLLVLENENEDKRDVLLLFIYLFKYARNYIKMALAESEIHTADEFAFVISVLMTPELTKTELFQRNIVEKTSGTEILKRLVKKGLIHEYKSDKNKKNIYLKITQEGEAVITRVLPKMQEVTEIVSGNLSEFEVKNLLKSLAKLEALHNDIYNQRKDQNLTQILDFIKQAK